MAMMMGTSGKSKLMLVAMFGMIGVRLSIFALSTIGLVTWAPPLGASVLSWVVPVGMPIVMISYMVLFRRRKATQQQMAHGSDGATAVASSTPQLFPPMATMQHFLSKKSHRKRNIAIVAGFVGFMVSMHILVLGGFIVQGTMAPYGIIIVLAVMVVMFVFRHSRVSKQKPGPMRTPEPSSTP